VNFLIYWKWCWGLSNWEYAETRPSLWNLWFKENASKIWFWWNKVNYKEKAVNFDKIIKIGKFSTWIGIEIYFSPLEICLKKLLASSSINIHHWGRCKDKRSRHIWYQHSSLGKMWGQEIKAYLVSTFITEEDVRTRDRGISSINIHHWGRREDKRSRHI